MNEEFLIVGAGVAGLSAAIELGRTARVLVVAKDRLSESASEYAQGGIAAALSDDDEVELHEQDTILAGDGLCDRDAVRTLVEEGPRAIEQLIEWGAQFDRQGSKLMFAREGAHSRSRVLHAYGDSTGREISRTLYEKAASQPGVEFRTYSAVTDLLVEDGEVCGAVVEDSSGVQSRILTRAVLLATGGLGRVYSDTTNPDVATGDGVAMAWRAGAVISDIEFVQFHPTALYLKGAPRFLLSEAMRGEGAYLRNSRGERFCDELAPRDVVARGIIQEMKRSGSPQVFLDLTQFPAGFVSSRFPRIYQTCLEYGLDISISPAPIHPAAHYAMGGVKADLWGRTSVPRLFSAGESACTGVHGANRLASNSLLEGVVFGARAGRAMLECPPAKPRNPEPPMSVQVPETGEFQLRRLAWEACGIERNGGDLLAACNWLDSLAQREAGTPTRKELEIRNISCVIRLIAGAALARQESRGAHYRTDFPAKNPNFERHSLASRSGVTFGLR